MKNGMRKLTALVLGTAMLSAAFSVSAASDVVSIDGVDDTQFTGGVMEVTSQVNFADLFEGDGSNGTNGTVKWEVENAETGEKTSEGLKATKVDDGIRFSRAGTTGANPGRGKAMMDKTYNLPKPIDSTKPYYLELNFNIQSGGAVNFDFGKNISEDETLLGDTSVARIRKKDDTTSAAGAATTPEGPAAYSYRINDEEKASAAYSAAVDVNIGIYADPDAKKLVFYKDGSKVGEAAEDFSDPDAVLDTLRVTWFWSIRWYNIPEGDFLKLRNIKVYENSDKIIVKSDNLALNKDVTGNATAINDNYGYAKITDGDTKSRLALSDGENFAQSGKNKWIQIDLGEETTFNEVDIKEFRKRLKTFKLQYSSDGETWTDIKTVSLTANNENVDPFVHDPYKFDAVTGRYLRVDITANAYDSSTKKYVSPSIYEIEVYNSFAALPGFNTEKPQLKTEFANGDVTVSANVSNVTDTEKGGCLIVGLYDKTSGELLDAKLDEHSVSAWKEADEFTQTVTVTDSANQEIKAVFLDGSTNLSPLTAMSVFSAE